MYYAHLGVTMPAQSVEEELAELAALVEEAERLGFDPWPPEKPDRPWAKCCLLYTSPSPRDNTGSRMPSSA